MKLFLLILCLLSFRTYASMNYIEPILYVGTTAAVVVGTEAAIYNSLVETELKSWSDKETGTSVRLENQCGMNAELHLTGSHRRNSLFLGLTNTTSQSISVKLRESKFIYDKNRVRYPGYSFETSDTRISPGWWQIAWIPFPSKEEFKGIKTIDVEIPVIEEKSGKVCVIKSQFNRTSVVEEEENSYSVFEFMMDFGPSLTQSGKIKELGDPSGIWAMEFNFYPKPNHGVGMAFSSEFNFSGGDSPRIIDEFSGRSSYHATASYFGLQYIYRHFLNEKWYVSFAIGPGFQVITEDRYNHYHGNDNGTIDFAIADKLMLNWIFSSWKTPGTDIDFFTGIGINHYWSPSADLNGQDLSGHRISGLLRIGMGF